MEIELGQSFIETPLNLQNIAKQLQSMNFGIFQKRIYFAYGISNMIHSFDLCAILFLTNQPLLIGGYLLFYVFGYIVSAKIQIKLSISERIGAQLQIGILLLISMTKIFQYQYLLLTLILIKSLISGYCNGLLQFLRYTFLSIQFNMGYLMAIFIILQLYFFKTETQIIHVLIGEQVLILLSCIYRAKYLPPLLEQIENSEIDQYLRYINKCVSDDSVIDYEEQY